MSIRSLIIPIAVAAALLTYPVVASAVPVRDGVSIPSHAAPTAVLPSPGAPAATPDTGGTDSGTVALVAGLTLLGGIALGFQGSRIMRRERRSLRPSAS